MLDYEAPPTRQIIFISHATPQDNDFTLWLGARLASAGYLIWSDLTRLIGGEKHWDDISDAIRRHSAKVISVCSEPAFGKSGWQDELSLSLAVEKSEGLADFIIPLRIDNTPWNEFPVEIIRRNGIDFYGGWHKGLSQLLNKLDSHGCPRRQAPDTDALSDWSASLLEAESGLSFDEELLIANSFEIDELPSIIVVSRLLHGAIAPALDEARWPFELRKNWAYSFAHLNKSEDAVFAPESQIELREFLSHGDSTRGVPQREAAQIVSALIRRQMIKTIVKRGLASHSFANNRTGFFLEAEEGQLSPRIRFVDPWGQRESRALNGYSPKNKVFWHYSPELLPQIGRTARILCVAHVIFTEDGMTPIEDYRKAHRLRRGFCKNWWQDRWRGLMLAYLNYLSDGESHLEVRLAEDVSIFMPLTPSQFVCPVTACTPTVSREAIDDEPLVDLNEYEFDESDIDL